MPGALTVKVELSLNHLTYSHPIPFIKIPFKITEAKHRTQTVAGLQCNFVRRPKWRLFCCLWYLHSTL